MFGISHGGNFIVVDMPPLTLRLILTCVQVSTGVKWARDSGALPPPDPSDLEPPTPDPDDDDRLESEGKGKSEGTTLNRGGRLLGLWWRWWWGLSFFSPPQTNEEEDLE